MKELSKKYVFMGSVFAAFFAAFLCLVSATFFARNVFAEDVSQETVCAGDKDCDGLSDIKEDVNNNGIWDVEKGETDATNPDTDGDGILDGDEGDLNGDEVLGPNESSPLKSDTDGDGVLDGDEERFGTYINKCDSDTDGLSDGIELGKIQPNEFDGCHGLQAAGTNFKKPTELSPTNPDSDGDGLLDGEEDANGNGWLDPDESDPSIADSDSDGLDDGLEALGDFDGDGVPDFDWQSIKAGGECSPPTEVSDLDCDGVPNYRDDDSDNDGCPDSIEGKWVDSNTNNIPDVYDFQTKICPDTADSSSGGGSSGPPKEQEEKGPVTSLGPDPSEIDGPACTFVGRLKASNDDIITLLMMVFLTSFLSIFRIKKA